MIYKRKNLQRLWEVKVFKGDRHAKKPKTETLTCIAWNDVDVYRKVGDRIAEPPTAICFVYLDESSQYQRIEDTSGPTGKKVKADIL